MIAPGTWVGRYEVIGHLGAGGMGEVYRARDPELGREVAIKIIAASARADEATVERFFRETRAAAALSHAAIIGVHDVGTHGGSPFLVTELLEGESLRARMERDTLDVRAGVDIAVQIAHGLAAAHARGILHRDLKPDNLFLTFDGGAKILDFGLAKLIPSSVATGTEHDVTAAQLTRSGTVLGTPAYMAPEQAQGREVDHRGDQFAFGVVLYEIFSGKRPFLRASVHETIASILRDEPPNLATLRPEVPERLARIVTRCLAKEPSDRYQSTRDLATALEEVRADLSAESRPHDPIVRVGTRRMPLLRAGVIAVLLTLVIGMAAWRWFTPHEQPAVAVLPFSTIGGDDQYLADGITDAVTTEMGRVGGLRVIASNSTFAYRDKTNLRDIARALGVRFLVRGSVQRAGGTVRINVSLVDTRDDTSVWSERYSRQVNDVLAVQDDISRQIAMTLSNTLGTPLPPKAQSIATTNPEAYDAYLRGMSHLKGRAPMEENKRGQTSRLATIAEFERAVAIDGNFALAHAALGTAYTQWLFYEAPDPDFEQKAFLAIERALRINPNQAEAYLARAQLIWNQRNQFPHAKAIGDLRRAVSINPNLADAYVELGKIYYHLGLTDKAVEANERALRLDPSARIAASRKVRALIDASRIEEVRQELDRMGASLPAYVRADALLTMGQAGEALKVFRESEPLEIGQSASALEAEADSAAFLCVVYARLGDWPKARRMVEIAIPKVKNPTGLSHMHHGQFHIGGALALLGDHDEAMKWLTRAASEGYPSYPRFSTDESLAPLRSHAGFVKLLARLRQEREHWNKL